MINVVDFNPIDNSTQSETDIVLKAFLNPANIYKLRLKTFSAKKGGSGSTQILPRVNIKSISVSGLDRKGKPISEKMLRSSHEIGLFTIDFGEMITQVQLLITLDSDFSLPLASGNNPFSAIIETNESHLDLKTPLVISKRDCSNQFITTKSIMKVITITADSSNPAYITVQGYCLSDNDGGASFTKTIYPGKSETFIGSLTCITVAHSSGLAAANLYAVTGYRE